MEGSSILGDAQKPLCGPGAAIHPMNIPGLYCIFKVIESVNIPDTLILDPTIGHCIERVKF